MMEEQLVNYGPLGIMIIILVSLLVKQMQKDDKRDEKMSRVIENNTVALTKVHETIKRCSK